MRVKRIDERAIMPTRGSEDSVGWDLYAIADNLISIRPQETKVIHTGIAIEVPKGSYGAIHARSGLATKRGLRMANGVGVVDPDYRGEVLVAMYNDSDETQLIFPGDRIAQLIITRVSMELLEEVEELTETERGMGGFGSTGT